MARKRKGTKDRTSSGGVSSGGAAQAWRGQEKRFPVFDRKSAMSAIHLRGHAKSKKDGQQHHQPCGKVCARGRGKGSESGCEEMTTWD